LSTLLPLHGGGYDGGGTPPQCCVVAGLIKDTGLLMEPHGEHVDKLALTLTPWGTKRFEQLTREHVGCKLAFVVDRTVVNGT
jgi:hypothetical protein